MTFTSVARGRLRDLLDVSQLQPADAVHQRYDRERRHDHVGQPQPPAHHDRRHGHDLLYDRRQRPAASGGGVSPTALQYGTTGITLTQGEEIKARVLSGGVWSALNDSVFVVNVAPYLRVTELMYDPTPATTAEIGKGYTSVDGAEDFEFIEIQNTGTTALPLQGVSFTNGVTFTFPNVSVAAGGYIVACSDPAAFAIRYGSTISAERIRRQLVDPGRLQRTLQQRRRGSGDHGPQRRRDPGLQLQEPGGRRPAAAASRS